MPSSVIKYFNYDAALQVLTITFMSGVKYRYFDVLPGVVGRFKRAPSKGAFFSRHIRPVYRFMRLE